MKKMILQMRIKFICFFLLISTLVEGQVVQFSYARKIENPTDLWHTMTLPNDIFANIKPDISDLRIYGINSQIDTLEAPYLLQTNVDKIVKRSITFEQINSTHNENGYYYTFKISNNETINQIQLDFNESNFDWKVNLEGSQDQREWFTLIEDYRIVSIQNQRTKYQYTQLVFPKAKYRYFRLIVKSKTDPKLATAKLQKHETTPGEYQQYNNLSWNSMEQKKEKQTEIKVDLGVKVPVSSLQFEVSDKVDYYRNVRVQYLADSFKVENGWKYTYNTLSSDFLTSFEKNELAFKPTILQHLKIIISNNDNTPLSINNIIAQGPVYQLISRFIEPADYHLYYGNQNTRKPNYDIARFTNNIPENPKKLALGNEIRLKKEVIKTDKPLFQNKIWLWAIMLVIIALLGWFSLKMLKQA